MRNLRGGRSGWVRAKRNIKEARIPFRVPPVHLLRERLDAILAVVYLIFNESYGGRDELAAEAIWLGRALVELLPADPEVRGLLAMILLHDSRREARFRHGELVLPTDQDRSRWDTEEIADGRAEFDRALALGGRGPYVLQAAIASLHAEVPCDWAQIAALLRQARPPDRLARRGAEPRDRHRRDRRPKGRPAHHRPTRSGRLPLPALDQGRTPTMPRAGWRGAGRLSTCEGTHRQRRGTASNGG